MKKVLVLALAMAFCSTAATATDLDVTVEAVGSSTVAPGATVDYQVIGKLSDSANEGLALVGLDLEFDGGDLAQANAPTEMPMSNFVIPDGLTNPAGYGGTVQSGNLIQCGGGQNTIMNGQKICNSDEDCPLGSNCIGGPPGICEPVADFPLGTVFTGIALPSLCTVDTDCPMDTTVCRSGSCWQILVTGSLTAPGAVGDYELSATNVFANVIKEFEDGNPFWATEAAGVGTVTNLPILVRDTVAFVSAVPASEGSLWRTANNVARITFGGAIPALPGSGELEIVELLDGGAYGSDLSGSFTFAIEGGNVLKIAEGETALAHRTWYAIRNTGGWAGVSSFMVHLVVQVGDGNGDGRVQFNDLSFINTGVPTDPAADDDRKDINGDGRVQFNDLSAANASIPSDTVPKPTGH